MRFKIDTFTVVIHQDALRILAAYAQHQLHQPEAGGILLGKYVKDEIQVLKISTPTELDKATRHSFERHRLSAQLVIDYEFHNSSGQVTYLGEWHTHPEDHPIPSSVDRKMMRGQFKESKHPLYLMLLLIQGTKSLYLGGFCRDGLRQGITAETD